MVQVIQGQRSLNDAGNSKLAEALGQGLGNGLNTYFASRSLDSVLKDKSLDNAPASVKIGRLEEALRPYGQNGQKILQNRLMVEQQAENEKQTKSQKKKADVFRRRLEGEPVTEEEKSLFSPQEELAIAKYELQKNKEDKKTQASKPIDPEQLKTIKNVRSQQGFEDLDELGQYRAFIDYGVSKENAEAESRLRGQQLTRKGQEFDKSYEAQKSFIDDTTKAYKGFETEMKPRLLQMRNIKDEDLIGPTASVFLDSLGIPLGALENPSSELYNKLSLDLLKGLPETYGNRILKVEVDNFLKTIPSLMNSPDGRRMIASNMLKLGEMKEVYYNAMRQKQKDHLENGKPLPKDFQQEVFDQVKPQIDRINNDFVNMSEVTKVPKDTIPFFTPNGQVEFVPKEHAQWAQENGGRRIW